MVDFPDFTIPRWDRRDWAAKEVMHKFWDISWLSGNPGTITGGLFYQVPIDKIMYWSDYQAASELAGRIGMYNYETGDYFFRVVLDQYGSRVGKWSTPLTGLAKQRFRYESYNHDIITGYYYVLIIGWELAASEPEKPKTNDPEERYWLGDFNWVKVLGLENSEQIFLFGKTGENRMNYLRFKNYLTSKQKKLGSFHLSVKKARKIFGPYYDNPKKLIKVLLKYEKKYKNL